MGIIDEICDPGPFWVTEKFFDYCINYTAIRIMESEAVQGNPTLVALLPLHMHKDIFPMTMVTVDLIYFPHIITQGSMG